MSIEEKRFEIDQLRKDKIIYAMESCAVSLVCLVGIFGVDLVMNGLLNVVVKMLLVMLAVGYAIYMVIGNSGRLKMIKKLESELK